MIINNDDAEKRLNSPLNLINRLAAAKTNAKAKEAMSIFIPRFAEKKTETNTDPSDTKTILEQVLDDSESQIKLGLAHNSAINLLNNSISILSTKLDDVNASKLPQVILAASKTIESIRKERLIANKNNKDKEVHYHFYVPEQKKVEDFEVIDVA